MDFVHKHKPHVNDEEMIGIRYLLSDLKYLLKWIFSPNGKNDDRGANEMIWIISQMMLQMI